MNLYVYVYHITSLQGFAPFLSMTLTMMSAPRPHRLLVVLLLIVALCQHVVAQDDGVCDCTSECELRVLENAKTWTQRVAELESAAQTEQEKHDQEIATLSANLQESKDLAQASMERANSLRKEHDESLAMFKKKCEHDLSSCQEAQEETALLKARVEQLNLVEQQVDTLKRQVETLAKEKGDLIKSREKLEQELHASQTKLQATNDKYLESSRKLLQTKEEYLELEKEFSSTFINFKLMRDTVVGTAKSISDLVQHFWKDTLAPWWNKIATPMQPYVKFIISVAGPVLKSTLQLIQDVFHQQVVPFWNLHVIPFWHHKVYPKMEPTIQPWVAKHSEFLKACSTMVQHQSHALYSYMKLLEGRDESKLRKRLLEALQYCDEHSARVVRIFEHILCLVIGFWIVAGCVAWRRHGKRNRADPRANATNGPALAYPNHARKKNQ